MTLLAAMQPELSNASVPLLADSAPPAMKPLKRLRFLVAVICALLCAGTLLCVYLLRFMPEFSQYRLLRAYQAQVDADARSSGTSQQQAPRTILLWNSFFGDKRWSLGADTLGPAQLRDELRCPVYRCEVTSERDFLPALDMYDAVLFHAAEPYPLLRPVPPQRHPRQRYVFALMESPGETKHLLTDEGGFYNLTMSYRLDSDIVWPYHYILDNETGAVVAPAVRPAWRQPPAAWNDTTVWQLWSGKTKMAAWFVSHCQTLSKREQLTAALQQYIEVDIYGKCGTMSCAYASKECDELLDHQYKFYFSFENSLCIDYVTEKLYNALKLNVVPVVYGGADYRRFLPPHSYINVEDFESVSALAAYLQYLSTHPIEYMRYFWWRRYYRLGYVSPFCDLCEKLHSSTYEQKVQTYQNIENWWLANQCRFEAKIELGNNEHVST